MVGGLELQNESVGRVVISNLDTSYVTGDNVAGVAGAHFDVVEGVGGFGLELFEGLKDKFGVGFLPDNHDGIEDENDEDGDGFDIGNDAFVFAVFATKEVGKNKEDSIGHEEDLDKCLQSFTAMFALRVVLSPVPSPLITLSMTATSNNILFGEKKMMCHWRW